MVIKAVSLFLVAILVLAMFGRLRLPGKGGKGGRKAGPKTAKKCPECGSYILGDGPCACRGRG
jgi:hypothetical protein